MECGALKRAKSDFEACLCDLRILVDSVCLWLDTDYFVHRFGVIFIINNASSTVRL